MKLFKKIALLAVGATMAIGMGVGVFAGNSFSKTEAVNYAAEADFTQKTANSSSYNSTWTYGSWTLFGAANNNGGWAFMKFGGKNTTIATSNPVYCRGQIASKAVSQIDVVFNAGNLTVGSVNSWGVKVYSDSYSTLVDTVVGGTMAVKTAQTLSLIPGSAWSAGRYYEVYFDLANTTSTNGIVWVDKIQFVENVDVSKTLTDLDFTGTPTTTTYNEGDDFDPTGITVTATYSDSSTSDVTDQVIWEDLVQGMTSVEGSYTYLTNTLTVEVTGLTVNAAPVIGGIVDGHAYLITATNNGTDTYILKAGDGFVVGDSDLNTATFSSAANYSLADAYVFTKVGTNQYNLTSGANYLNATATNNGLVLSTTTDVWTASVNTYGYDGIHLLEANNGRYLTVYAAAPDFRSYTGTNSQGNYAACIVLYDMTALDGFASNFNLACQGVCDNGGSTNVSSLASVWSAQSTAFSGLLSKEQAVFADTTNAIGNESGTTIQQAISKYEYIAAKYNTQLMATGWEFMGRNISASSSANLGLNSTNSSAVLTIVLVSFTALVTTAGYFLLKKKKEVK